MPKLPDETALGPRPTPQPAGGVAVADTSAIGRGVQALGGAVADIATQREQEQTQQFGFDQRRGYVDLDNQLKQDALSKRGADALNLPQAIAKTYDDYTSQQLQSATSKPQRQVLQELAINRKAAMVGWATDYAAQQKKVYDADNFDADISSMQQDAANNAANPNSVATNVALIAHRTQDYLQSIGAPQSQIDQVTREQQGKAIGGVTESLLANGDYKGAKGYVDSFKDVLTPQQQFAIGNKIDEYAAPDMATAIYQKHGGDLHTALQESMGIDKPSLRNGVQRLIREQYSIDQADRRENFALLSESASQGIQALQAGVNLTPEVSSQIDQTIRGLRAQGGPEGAAGKRLADRLETAQGASQLAAQMSAMPLPQQQAFVEQHIAQLPQATDLESAQRAEYTAKFLRSAFQKNVKDITTDPYGVYAKQTGQALAPLDFNGDVMSQLAARVPVAAKVEARWGVNPVLFMPQEVQTFRAAMEKDTPEDQARLLSNLNTALGNDQLYRGAVQQIAPDSPVVAHAGLIAAGNSPVTLDTHWFDPNDIESNQQTAATILKGNRILNPNADERKADGKPLKFPVPDDSKFTQAFAQSVGDTFANRPEALSYAMQVAKAYYVGKASAGDLSKEYASTVNQSRLDQAIKTTLGEVVDVNGKGSVLAPRGMDQSSFNDRAAQAFSALAERYPNQRSAVGSFGLENTGDDGKYAVKAGNSYLLDEHQQPIVLDLLNLPPKSKTKVDAPEFSSGPGIMR